MCAREIDETRQPLAHNLHAINLCVDGCGALPLWSAANLISFPCPLLTGPGRADSADDTHHSPSASLCWALIFLQHWRSIPLKVNIFHFVPSHQSVNFWLDNAAKSTEMGRIWWTEKLRNSDTLASKFVSVEKKLALLFFLCFLWQRIYVEANLFCLLNYRLCVASAANWNWNYL